MVKRFFKIFHREFNGMNEAAYLLGIFALLSQILGIFRDRLLANIFGASLELDIYYAAFRIPDFLFVSLASLAGAYVLIPFLIRKKEEGAEAAKEFLSGVFTALFSVMAVVALVLFIAMPYLTPLIAPGFPDAAREQFIFLSRLLLVSPFLLGFSNLLGSITQSSKKFFVFAVSPVLYNLGIILGILFVSPAYGVRGIAVGVILGAFLHLAIQLPAVLREGLLPRFGKVRMSEIIPVFATSLPRTLALSASYLAILILSALASLISAGSISIFQFAFNLQSVPLSIIGVSYSVAAFPTLARAFGAGDMQKFFEHISTAVRHVIFWSIPVVFLFVVLRAQIVRVILGSGEFNWDHTRLTAACLALFVVSLLAQNIVLLFARGYYAAGNTKRPVYINVASSAVAVLLGFSFFSMFQSSAFFRNTLEAILRIEGIPGSLVTVLPLAFTCGMVLNAVLLWKFFQKDFGYFAPKILRSLLQSIVASSTLAFVAWVFLQIFANVFDLDTFMGIFLQGFLSGILGIAALIISLYFMKNPELTDTLAVLSHKFWKIRPVAPEQEKL